MFCKKSNKLLDSPESLVEHTAVRDCEQLRKTENEMVK